MSSSLDLDSEDEALLGQLEIAYYRLLKDALQLLNLLDFQLACRSHFFEAGEIDRTHHHTTCQLTSESSWYYPYLKQV